MTTKFSSGSRSSKTGGFWRYFGPYDDGVTTTARQHHDDDLTTMCRQHDDNRPTAWRRHDDEATTVRRRSDDHRKPGFGIQPQLMTCHKPGFGAEPGLWHVKPGLVTVVALCRRIVVMSSSKAVVMPSVYRHRAVGTSSSCCRAIVVRPSAHCRRAVAPIIISTRRDFSYPTSACLLNFASIYIYIHIDVNIEIYTHDIYIYMYAYVYIYIYIYICMHIYIYAYIYCACMYMCPMCSNFLTRLLKRVYR